MQRPTTLHLSPSDTEIDCICGFCGQAFSLPRKTFVLLGDDALLDATSEHLLGCSAYADHVNAATQAASLLAATEEQYDALLTAGQELVEVARLRGEFDSLPDDGRLWVARWQDALHTLKAAVDGLL